MTNDKTLKHFALVAALALTALPSGATAQDTSTSSAPAEGATGETAEASDEESTTEGSEAASTEAASTEEGESTEGTSLSAPTDEGGEGEGEGEGDEVRTEAEAEEAQAASEPLAWRNSFFSWTQGLTFNTFVRDGQQTYDPTYYWSFSLIPRWYIEPTLFLVAIVGVSYELTDSNFDTYNHELALSDSLLELRYTAVADRFVFIPAVRLTFPTSKASQAAQRYFNTGIGLTTVLQIPEFLSSNLALGLAYRRWWAGSNVALTSPYPGTFADATPRNLGGGSFSGEDGDVGPGLVDSMGGAAAASDRILVALTLNVTPASGLTLTLQGLMVFDHLFDNSEACLPGGDVLLTTPVGEGYCVPMAANNQRWRPFTYFTLAAAYDVQPWLNLQLGVANAAVLAPLFNDDGSVRSPFNPDTQVYLSTTLTLDGIYETITAGGEEDGLTPEERQRRRQGLAAIEEELLEELLEDDTTEEDGEGTDVTSRARATVAF